MPAVSVVVPAHQASRVLPSCLEALARSLMRPSEVIVADDGPSTDGTGEIARAHGARVVETPRRLGPGGARNAGVAAAAGEIVVFVDADVCVRPNALGLLAGAIEGDAGLVAAFGSYDTSPPGTNFTSQYKNLMHHYVHQRGRENAFTFWAGLGAVRRESFLAAGGFDSERYPRPSIEDIELGARLLEAGGRIRLVKSAQGTHLKNWTFSGLLKTDVFDRGVPWMDLILSSGHLPDDLNLGLRHRIGVAATGLALASLPFAFAKKRFPYEAAALGAVAVVAGGDALAFLARRRGVLFAARAIPLHLAYYASSGVAFAIGAGRHLLRSRQSKIQNPKSKVGATRL